MKEKMQFLSKKSFVTLQKYSKYSAVVSGIFNKIFRKKVKSVNAIEAVSSGIFDMCSFMSEFSCINNIEDAYPMPAEYSLIFSLLKENLPRRFIKISDHNSSYYEYSLISTTVLSSFNNYRGELIDTFIKKPQLELVLSEIKELFWKQYDKHVLLSLNKNNHRYDENQELVAKIDDLSGLKEFRSHEFFTASEYINKFYKNNKNRALIFYGNPGVGKSTIIKQIANELDAKTIRISMDSFKDFDSNKLLSIISMLKPDIFIVDDFDRIEMTSSMLPIFEELHKQIKLTMISVNNLNYFEDNMALVRPERFDKFFKIEKLDDAIIEKIMGKEYMYLFDKIQNWPAAYIRELKENITILGNDIIDECIKELDGRIEFQNKGIVPDKIQKVKVVKDYR